MFAAPLRKLPPEQRGHPEAAQINWPDRGGEGCGGDLYGFRP